MAAVRIEAAERASVDEQMFEWHREARGYKARHVPAALQNLLKTEAAPRHELEAFAAGEGGYSGLDRAVRAEQLTALQWRRDELYPSLRLFAFDARKVCSAPMTAFSPILAVIYVGRYNLSFRNDERAR